MHDKTHFAKTVSMKPPIALLAFVHSIFLAYVTATLRAVDFEMSNIVQSNVIWQVRQMSTINLSFGIRYSCLEQTESDVPPKINMRNCVGGHCTMNSPSCHDRDVECIGEKWPPLLFSSNKGAIYTKIQAYGLWRTYITELNIMQK